jgi:Radical SAM superfamily
VFVDRHNDDYIRVAPCCNAGYQEEKVDTFNFYTSPHLTKLRNQFDQGQRPAECQQCWHAEELGQKSRRQSAIEFYGIDEPDTTVRLESIDHNATWACNLACVMCGPRLSSTWAKELRLNNNDLVELGRKFQKSNNFLEHVDLEHVKKVHFNGGEPLLNNDQTDLLEQLDQQGVLGNVFISYNTNGTVWPTDRVIDLWSRARLVKLFFSIDATGNGYEYVRYPGNWNEASENIQRMKNELPGNVMFGFNISVGTYNVFEIMDVWAWFEKFLRTNREGDISDFCWQLVYNFDVKNLNLAAKEHAIMELSHSTRFQGIVDYLKSTINYKHSDDWTTDLNLIDQRRGTNWRQTMRVGKYY